MSLQDKLNKDREENKNLMNQQGSTDWFKFQEGKNVVRILVEPEFLAEAFKVGICYTGCGYQGTPKYLTWVIDRADGKLKLFKMPYSLFETIANYENSSRFKFNSFPMPYDLEITAKNAGTKEVTYTPLPGEESPVSQETLDSLAKEKGPKEIIESMKAKQKERVERGEVRPPKKEEMKTIQLEENEAQRLHNEDDGSANLEDIPF